MSFTFSFTLRFPRFSSSSFHRGLFSRSDMSSLCIEASARELVDSFRKALCLQAELLVSEFFPKKLLEVDNLLKEKELNLSDLSVIRSELDIPIPDPAKEKQKAEEKKKREEAKKAKETSNSDGKEKNKDNDDEDSGPPCGPIPSNEKILALVRRVKPEIILLKEKSSIVSIWIQLHIPKIEDGNNFGVAVQEKVFETMTNSRTKIDGFQTQLNKYFQDRGEAVAKASKEQHVNDYRELVSEIDENEYIELRAMVMEIRHQYAILYDIITKNITKIKSPRGESKVLIY